MTPLIYWNWFVATWIFLIISISTIISFQCFKKGKNAKPAAGPAPTTPGTAPSNSALSKPSAAGGAASAATPNPTPAAADADGKSAKPSEPPPPKSSGGEAAPKEAAAAKSSGGDAPKPAAEAAAPKPAEEADPGNYEDVAVGTDLPPPK